MCMFTICSVEYVFSYRNVDLVFSFYFLSNSLLQILMDSHWWIFIACLGRLVDTRCLLTLLRELVLDHACLASDLDASFGKGQ